MMQQLNDTNGLHVLRIMFAAQKSTYVMSGHGIPSRANIMPVKYLSPLGHEKNVCHFLLLGDLGW